MSGSRIRVDVNNRTTVNVSRSSGGVESQHFSVEAQSAKSQSLLPPSFPPAVAPAQALRFAPFQRPFGPYVRYRLEFHHHRTVLRSSLHDPDSPSEVTPPDPPKRNVGPKDDTVAPNVASQTITHPGPSHYSREGQSYNPPDSARHYISVVKRKKALRRCSGGHKNSGSNMVDQVTLDKLDTGFKKLQDAKDCKLLLKKYLTKNVFEKLKARKTAMGATLLGILQSGVENLDSGVGLCAPDAESYTRFADLFNPEFEDYHGGFKVTDKHPPTDSGDINTRVNVDPDDQFVVSTRVRCGRSLQVYPFNSCLTEAQYREMEEKASSTLRTLEGELKGTYYPLTGMDKKTQQQLIDDHFLFKEGDRFQQA
ncbi:unnamed protein product, partial [Ixodes persulcatus]